MAENIALIGYGGTSICTTTYGNAPSENVFDGNLSTSISLRQLSEVFVLREWEQNAIIDEIKIEFSSSQRAIDFDIYYWEYGMWKIIKQIRDNEAATISIPLEGIVTRKLLYKSLKFNSSYNNIREIVVEGIVQEPYVPQPEEFVAERSGESVYLKWEAPLETKEGAQATAYNVLKADVVNGNYENWETIATGLVANSWSGEGDLTQSSAYSVVAVDKWDYLSEMAEPVILHALGAISGKVVDEQFQPLTGALIRIRGLGVSSKAASDGQFSLVNVPVGIVELEVSKEGYIRDQRLVVLTEAGISNLNFTLQQAEELLAAPALLNATSQPGKIILEWTPAAESQLGPIKYNLYRSETPGIKQGQLTPLAWEISSTSWIDTTVIPGKVYYYAVTAVSVTSHESDFSTEVKALCQSQEAPVLVEPNQYAVIHNHYVVMRWEPLSGASHYFVEYSRSPKFSPEQTKGRTIRTGTQLVDLGLADGNWYWRVRAIFLDGTTSAFSQTGSFSVLNTLSGNSPAVAFFDLWPKTVGKEPYVNIHYILNIDDLLASIRVYDLNGRCVKTFFDNYHGGSGHHEFSWDGRGDNGMFLQNGLYIMQFIAAKPGQKYEVRKKIIVMN